MTDLNPDEDPGSAWLDLLLFVLVLLGIMVHRYQERKRDEI